MWLKEARAKKRKGRKKKRYLRLRLIKQNGTRDWRILLMLRLQKKGGGGVSKASHKKAKKKKGYFRVNLLSARQQMQDEELSFSYCLVFCWQEEHL